jgi:hypothetical protein
MNLEKIAEEIKLELHDKHMMYIDGEDQVTHRWCKQIIWRVIKKHFDKYQENSVVLINRFEADQYANDVLQRRLEDDEWQKIVKEIHEAQDYIDGAYVHMSDMICEMDKTCEDCGGQGSFDREPFPNYDICETCDGTGEIE